MREYKITEMNITNRCNGNCKFCIRQEFPPKNIKDMSLDILEKLSNIKHICLTSYNGEPTLHPKFIDIIKILEKKNIPVSIYTNCSTHDEKWWYRISELLSYHRINNIVSHLDGLKNFHEKYRGTSFNKTVSNMKSFTNAGGILYLRTLLFKGNEDDVDELYELSKEIGSTEYNLKPSWLYDIEGDYSKPVNYPMVNRIDKSLQNEYENVYCDLFDKKLAMDIEGNYYPCCRLLDKDDCGVRFVSDEVKNIAKKCKEKGELKNIESAMKSAFFQYILKNLNNIKRCKSCCSGGQYTPTIPINMKYKEIDTSKIAKRHVVTLYNYYKKKYPFLKLKDVIKLSNTHSLSLDRFINLWSKKYFEKNYNTIINNWDLVDAYCYSQYRGKNWLYQKFKKLMSDNVNVLIAAGWISTLSIFLLRLNNIKEIKSIDVDPKCKEISDYLFSEDNRFSSETVDIFDYEDYDKYDIIVNTSCEHFDYIKWLELIPKGKTIILQNTDKKHKTHTNYVRSLEEFKNFSNLKNHIYEGVLNYNDNSKRFMIIGEKK